MAVSFVASTAWATLTADGSVSIPGVVLAGQRAYVYAAWKDFSITAQVSGWTEVTEFADGSVSNGNGTGSVKVACWYKDLVGGDGNPTIDFSASPDVALASMLVMAKTAGEGWKAPTFVTAAVTSNTNIVATSSGSLTVDDGSAVMLLIGIRDDSATFTRTATTAIEDNGTPNVTWNGNYVEAPATHGSTTTGFDLAADLGYRLVTTGAAAVNLTLTGTLSAAETGAALWVHQGTNVNTVVTPTTLALSIATFAPQLQHRINGAAPTALVLSTFAPQLQTRLNLAAPTALTIATFAPTITVGLTLVPAPASLSIATFAPQLQHRINGAAPTALVLSTFAPQLQHRINGAAPTALTITTFAPKLVSQITVPVRALSLTTFAPQLDFQVTPSPAALVLAGYAPVLQSRVTVPATALVLTGFAPDVRVESGDGGPHVLVPAPILLAITGYPPVVQSLIVQIGSDPLVRSKNWYLRRRTGLRPR